MTLFCYKPELCFCADFSGSRIYTATATAGGPGGWGRYQLVIQPYQYWSYNLANQSIGQVALPILYV
jgi:hypothetical protein